MVPICLCSQFGNPGGLRRIYRWAFGEFLPWREPMLFGGAPNPSSPLLWPKGSGRKRDVGCGVGVGCFNNHIVLILFIGCPVSGGMFCVFPCVGCARPDPRKQIMEPENMSGWKWRFHGVLMPSSRGAESCSPTTVPVSPQVLDCNLSCQVVKPCCAIRATLNTSNICWCNLVL